jgi:hypothetical protein
MSHHGDRFSGSALWPLCQPGLQFGGQGDFYTEVYPTLYNQYPTMGIVFQPSCYSPCVRKFTIQGKHIMRVADGFHTLLH